MKGTIRSEHDLEIFNQFVNLDDAVISRASYEELEIGVYEGALDISLFPINSAGPNLHMRLIGLSLFTFKFDSNFDYQIIYRDFKFSFENNMIYIDLMNAENVNSEHPNMVFSANHIEWELIDA